jgi:hypothetical protein
VQIQVGFPEPRSVGFVSPQCPSGQRPPSRRARRNPLIKDQSLLQGLFLFIWGAMGWSDNPLKEHLVAFAKALDLALKKVWMLRVPELASPQRNMDFFYVRRQCSRHNQFQFGNPGRVTKIHPFKLRHVSTENPHLRHYLFSFSGLKSLLDVSFQEPQFRHLWTITIPRILSQKTPPMFLQEL